MLRLDPKEKQSSVSILQRDPEDLWKFRSMWLEVIPQIRQVPPLPSTRHGFTPEDALDELTPPAFGTELSSLLSFRISSGRKRIFLAVGLK